MKKIFGGLLVFFITIGLLVGCSQNDGNATVPDSEQGEQSQETENNQDVVITVTTDGSEIIGEEEVAVEENETLFEVMEDNFDIEATEQGFIESIDGVSQDEETGKWWMFEVNGEMPNVGAKELELESGDSVTFDLSASE